ncbi:hypothetical protein [Paenibacillus woosongensis]|uniref:Uncharacterized protein n=1 Tax=Paenibacillus woosongensis TaxID=307580 RepID=A0A7X2YX30_9BACL|nr:hypothetical protein [Paenibacillus woosongensis]MUG43441.1 hypothetical protein [Paenibacillus woosongensis]
MKTSQANNFAGIGSARVADILYRRAAQTYLPGPASRYRAEDGSICIDKVLIGLRELGADTTEIEAYLDSIFPKGSDDHEQ